MSAKSTIHQVRLNEWAIRISEQKASGLSVPDWCEQNNLTVHQYFYWKRQLKTQAVKQMLPDIVPISLETVPLEPLSRESTNLAPMTQVQNTTLASCTTCSCARVLINGISIELDSSASEEFIRTLIKAVRYA